MNRQEFMNILSDKIDCLPFEEKKSATNYYDEFFEDAGIENEQSVISNLGSPEFLAENILKSSGCFIESNNSTTYKENFKSNQNIDTQNTKKTEFKNKQSSTDTAFEPLPKPKNNNGTFNPMLIIILILAFPIWFPLLMVLFSLLVTLFSVGFALALVLFAIPVVTLACGILLIPSFPIASAFTFGLTVIFIGLLILFIPIVKWTFKGIGYAFKGLGRSIKNIFKKAEVD